MCMYACMCVCGFSTHKTRGWRQIKPIVKTPVQTCRASRERKTELEMGQHVCIPITPHKSCAPHLSKHLTHSTMPLTHTHTKVECSTGAEHCEFSSNGGRTALTKSLSIFHRQATLNYSSVSSCHSDMVLIFF